METKEQNRKLIKSGMIVKMEQGQYRILHIQLSVAVMCKMFTSKLKFLSVPVKELMEQAYEGKIQIIEEQGQRVFSVDNLSSSQSKKYEKRLKLIKEIKAAYGPSYLGLKDNQSKDALKKCINESGYSKSTVLRIIRVFLQSGEDPSSLIIKNSTMHKPAQYNYKNKPGRRSATGIIVNETVKEHFEEALADYKSNRATSMEDAYARMLRNHYSGIEDVADGGQELVLFPASERPTIRQLRYYVSKKLGREERDSIKNGKQEQRNNQRLLLSDNLHGVYGPGDLFEIDEVEVDVSLVSRIDRKQVVGRPVVYMMIDVFTRMIISYSVAYSNNSVQGLTNCLLSLLDDKVELCKKHGLSIDEDEWPSRIIPNRIRCDYGAEYRSQEAARIFAELGITRELVPPGTGSMKGQIEQVFHQLHCAQNSLLEGKGLIQKHHGSKHHQEAMLTIDEFEALILAFIVSHNRQYMAAYPRTIEMVNEGVAPIPKEIWAYGCMHYGAPKSIRNDNQFLFSLLTPISVSYNRKGIMFKGLYYINDDPHLLAMMYNAGNKRMKLENTRIDPRDVGRIYYLDQNRQLAIVQLNSERTGNDFHGYTLAEYQAFCDIKREMDKIGVEYEIERKVKLQEYQEGIVRAASHDKNVHHDMKNMSEARQLEKEDRNQDYAIKDRLDFVSDELVFSVDEEADIQKELSPIEGAHDIASAQINAFLYQLLEEE